MSTFVNLTILSPKGLLYEGEVKEVYVPSSSGPLGILPGHTPYIASLNSKGGVLKLAEASTNNELFFVIYGGALEVKKDKTFVLCEEGNRVSSFEEGEKFLKNNRIKETSPLNNDVKRAEASLTSTYSKSSPSSISAKIKNGD
jgi:F-type H+-transporting ATPase subunit epsilon